MTQFLITKAQFNKFEHLLSSTILIKFKTVSELFYLKHTTTTSYPKTSHLVSNLFDTLYAVSNKFGTTRPYAFFMHKDNVYSKQYHYFYTE